MAKNLNILSVFFVFKFDGRKEEQRGGFYDMRGAVGCLAIAVS